MFTKNKFLRLFLSSLFLFLTVFTFVLNAGPKIPSPTSYKYLNDYSSVIQDTEAKYIISIGKELEDKTGAQAVVVVVDSTEGIPIEDYAINLFRSWGIGQKTKDNGLLIVVSISDKAWRVEVGRGLEGAIPDVLSSRIMDSLATPSFIEENYGEGILTSYSALCDLIATEYGTTLDKSLNIELPNMVNPRKNHSIIWIILMVSLFGDLLFNRGRISSTLLQLVFWSNIGRRNGPGGGGFGGGGFGGGGFGGGSSNGGGSSGRWG